MEIFQYNTGTDWRVKDINQFGLSHIAFAVDNVEKLVDHLKTEGGSLVGKVIKTKIKGAGTIKFVYARDPEGNIIELQKWD